MSSANKPMSLPQSELVSLGQIRHEKKACMQYILTGFTHEIGIRVFAFEGIDDDRLRTRYRVKADLVLARRYGILIQELPALCRSMLEHRPDMDQRTFTYAESDMRLHADAVTARHAAAVKAKPPRRPQPAPAVVVHHPYQQQQ